MINKEPLKVIIEELRKQRTCLCGVIQRDESKYIPPNSCTICRQIDAYEKLLAKSNGQILKESFQENVQFIASPKYLVVAVQLPTGAVELITNTQQLEAKINYYLQAYDEHFRLLSNTDVQIINFMLV